MKRIIIVEDDPGIVDVMEIILKRGGYEPVIYTNAEPILDNRFEEPAVFIIDRQLPGVDGLDICRFLKRRHDSKTPVIVFSANSRVKKMAKEAGADEFLEKPFEIKAMIELIERLIATSKVKTQ